MTSGGACYHCGEHVTCLPAFVREFMTSSTIREGDYDPANRRWFCYACEPGKAIEQVIESQPPQPLDPVHQHREMMVLGLRASPESAAATRAIRAELQAQRDALRASQPWRRR